MKRVYVNEEWCLGCHLCEYNCAFANSGERDMVDGAEGKADLSAASTSRATTKSPMRSPAATARTRICVKSCIAGALSKRDGVIR